jgi:hypothetical protein
VAIKNNIIQCYYSNDGLCNRSKLIRCVYADKTKCKKYKADTVKEVPILKNKGKEKDNAGISYTDLYGRKVGEFTVTRKAHDSNWICTCNNCGKEVVVALYLIYTKKILPCACSYILAKKEIAPYHLSPLSSDAIKSHDKRSEVYDCWKSIVVRCRTKKGERYERYGSKGISVCAEWKNDFHQFLMDMGYKPTPKHTLYRIDSEKGYSKDNCRWGTTKEQANNKSNNVYLTHNERCQTVSEWSVELGVPYGTIYSYVTKKIDKDKIIDLILQRIEKKQKNKKV